MILLRRRPDHLRYPIVCRRARLLDHLTVHHHLHGELLPACAHLLSIAAHGVYREHACVHALDLEVLWRGALNRARAIQGAERTLKLDAGVSSNAEDYAATVLLLLAPP